MVSGLLHDECDGCGSRDVRSEDAVIPVMLMPFVNVAKG